MDPDVAMGLLIPLAGVAIICVTVVKLARLRLDFTERLLTKAREEKRVGG